MITAYLVAEDSVWHIPAYAQDMLWVQQEARAAQTSGPRGSFSLESTDEPITLTWGTAGGPSLLICEPIPGDSVGWQGTVGVGGFVERLHVLETHGLELVVAEIQGSLLPPNYRRLPTLAQMRESVFRRVTDADHPLPPEATYTFIAMADSIHAEYLHHAMVSELAVDCLGTLGPQQGHWHDIVGLPLLLDAVTLLAPGIHGF